MSGGALAQAVAEGRDELTSDEAEQFADDQAREYLGMSVDEFRRRAADGTLPEDDAMVIHIALLPGARLRSC
jgi:hypothetical protein